VAGVSARGFLNIINDLEKLYVSIISAIVKPTSIWIIDFPPM